MAKANRKQKDLIVYNNGASMRGHNKRIIIEHSDENTICINFMFADTEAEKPACRHLSHKRKIRQTDIKMSVEAMEMIVVGYLAYKNSKLP